MKKIINYLKNLQDQYWLVHCLYYFTRWQYWIFWTHIATSNVVTKISFGITVLSSCKYNSKASVKFDIASSIVLPGEATGLSKHFATVFSWWYLLIAVYRLRQSRRTHNRYGAAAWRCIHIGHTKYISYVDSTMTY